jgi:hypothetical protein
MGVKPDFRDGLTQIKNQLASRKWTNIKLMIKERMTPIRSKMIEFELEYNLFLRLHS